jgi:tetratricopeptide (TPR) repeat protein
MGRSGQEMVQPPRGRLRVVSRSVFDQYKEALRRGHLAVLAGRLEEAIEAYREAARIVPERALPHASLATALHRLGRWPEAEDAFAVAVSLAPEDASVLRARAAALEGLGRRADAAEDMDRVVAIQEMAGRRDEALTAARQAIELAGTAARHDTVARLEAPPPAPVEAATMEPADEESGGGQIVGPPPDPEVLLIEAAVLLGSGEESAARDLMLTAVAVHRAAGRPDAALEICFQLLALAPGDPQVHLAIAGLQLDRGWTELATEKIGLLLRLTSLTGDAQAEADVRALAAERLRDEPASAATR